MRNLDSCSRADLPHQNGYEFSDSEVDEPRFPLNKSIIALHEDSDQGQHSSDDEQIQTSNSWKNTTELFANFGLVINSAVTFIRSFLSRRT
ncbi:hypothetical protein [Candidatus Ichthyocystis hellenicum]|uniref:hypothetical protein n=1 Tax=Candidatus Ichthyocystis hellenicum TaxID=1561003 RepID=UPI000B80A66B|nr:hypothetical protein [Candidatus Ichthyocystis hellenicum]